MNFYYVYVLRSLKDHKFYIGFTEDLRKRYKQHQNAEVQSTKSRLPMELVFYEAYKNKYDALRREKYLKTTKGKTTLKSNVKRIFRGIDNEQFLLKQKNAKLCSSSLFLTFFIWN